jgi:hypothetical protein
MTTKSLYNQGFLLVEVMASLLVITGGLLLIGHSYGSSKRVYKRAAEVLRASILLDNQLVKIEDQGAALSVDQERFSGEDDHYRLTLHPETLPGSDLVCVTAAVADRQEVSLLQAVTYFKEKL